MLSDTVVLLSDTEDSSAPSAGSAAITTSTKAHPVPDAVVCAQQVAGAVKAMQRRGACLISDAVMRAQQVAGAGEQVALHLVLRLVARLVVHVHEGALDLVQSLHLRPPPTTEAPTSLPLQAEIRLTPNPKS